MGGKRENDTIKTCYFKVAAIKEWVKVEGEPCCRRSC